MSDYRIRITVRNARLLRAIEAAGHRPGEPFARAVGIGYADVLLAYLNLTRSPLGKDGLFRNCAWALCDFLGASPDELWSDEQLTPLARNSAQRDVCGGAIAALSAPSGDALDDPHVSAIRHEAAGQLSDALSALAPHEEAILRHRFGIGVEAQTLRAVAAMQGLSSDRVRQIEMRALYKLRVKNPGLAGVADAFDSSVDTQTQCGVQSEGGAHA